MSRHITTQRDRTLAVVVMSILLATTMTLGALPASANAEESQFVSLINQSRAANGLGALGEFWDLTDDARAHTAAMVSAGQIYHSTNAQLSSYTTGWDRMGENVGMGPDPSLLHQAFMSSPGHRANILGDFDRVGVGAARDSAGTLFVTVVFMKSTTAAPTTTTTTAPPTTTTTTTAPPTTTTTPPTTTTTAPPSTPTTTPPPSSTTTTAPSASTKASEPARSVTARMTVPTDGERPATRVANVRADRSVASFRPVFALLGDLRPDQPIDLRTPSGVTVTIE